MVWKPGESGNPAGKQRRSNILRRLRPEDMKTPDDIRGLNIVASIANFAHATLQMRLTAGSILAQYQDLKPSERPIEDLNLPKPTTVEIATENIAAIAHAVTSGMLAPDVAPKIIAPQKDFIDAVVGSSVEQRLAALEAAAERNPPKVKAVILGGLPRPPGSDVLMPEFPEFQIEHGIPLPDGKGGR
jgi:hypothetical protein